MIVLQRTWSPSVCVRSPPASAIVWTKKRRQASNVESVCEHDRIVQPNRWPGFEPRWSARHCLDPQFSCHFGCTPALHPNCSPAHSLCRWVGVSRRGECIATNDAPRAVQIRCYLVWGDLENVGRGTAAYSGNDGWGSRQPDPRAKVRVLVCGQPQPCAKLGPEIPSSAILRRHSCRAFLFRGSRRLFFTSNNLYAHKPIRFLRPCLPRRTLLRAGRAQAQASSRNCLHDNGTRQRRESASRPKQTRRREMTNLRVPSLRQPVDTVGTNLSFEIFSETWHSVMLRHRFDAPLPM
jgi:hypothetical protein